jgi:hypothetical protein
MRFVGTPRPNRSSANEPFTAVVRIGPDGHVLEEELAP